MGTEKKTGGHFRPCNVGTVEAHNERTPQYMNNLKKAGKEIYIFPEYSHLNSSWANPDNKGKSIAEIFQDMINKYKEKFSQEPQLKDRQVRNKKTGKMKTVSGWSPIREMVVPIKEDTKIEDFDYFKKWAESYGIDVLRIDLHFDEGRKSKDQVKPGNFHAHVTCSFFDQETCRTVKLDASKMSEMQTVLAISLDMNRGELKSKTNKEYLTHQEYREMKEEENLVKKNIDSLKIILKGLQDEEKKARTKVKGLTTMVTNLEAKESEKKAELKKLENKLNAGVTSEAEMKQRAIEIRNELEELETKIEDKRANDGFFR